MSARVAGTLCALVVAALAASCESPEAPSTAAGGKIVLRFDPAPEGAAPGEEFARAALFDSVVVNVFRAGSPLRLELARGLAVPNDDPIDVSVACIAEDGKKVGVDLYVGGVFVYHGFDSDVDVIADRSNAVTIDVAAFYITDLTITPGIIPDGAAFTLRWPPAAAATGYLVEESATPDFAVIASSEAAVDTTIDVHVGTGSHYFRVRPATPYASGPPSPPRWGYVTGGSNNVQITGTTAAVIPGETISITGENLDFPDVQATIGTRQLTLESVTWGEIVARVPRYATTDKVSVTSSLGSDTSDDDVVVQRVAYVNSTGEFATSTIDLLAQHAADFGFSGVASIPVEDLDTRDMSVFDIIIVANDTGDAPIRWAGKPARYSAITTSGASVLAVGEGGASFLRLALSAFTSVTTTETSLTSYYTSAPTASVFTTPHSVTSGTLPQSVPFCPNPERTIAFVLTSKPNGVNFYAETGPLSSSRVLFDFSTVVRYFYWGYAADPAVLSKEGMDCLGNVMNLLYTDRPVIPAQVFSRQRP